MLFTCEECGQPYNVTLLDLRNKKRKKCKQCSGGAKREKLTLENAIFILKENGFTIINKKEFINAKSKINIMDLEGYKYLINISDFILYKRMITKWINFQNLILIQ